VRRADWPGEPYTSAAEFERDVRRRDPITESLLDPM
jgi:hypothetical protein